MKKKSPKVANEEIFSISSDSVISQKADDDLFFFDLGSHINDQSKKLEGKNTIVDMVDSDLELTYSDKLKNNSTHSESFRNKDSTSVSDKAGKLAFKKKSKLKILQIAEDNANKKRKKSSAECVSFSKSKISYEGFKNSLLHVNANQPMDSTPLPSPGDCTSTKTLFKAKEDTFASIIESIIPNSRKVPEKNSIKKTLKKKRRLGLPDETFDSIIEDILDMSNEKQKNEDKSEQLNGVKKNKRKGKENESLLLPKNIKQEVIIEEQIVDIGSTGKSPSNSNQSNEVRRFKKNRKGTGNYTLPNSNEGELLEGQMVDTEDNKEGNGNKYNQLNDAKKTKKKKKDSAYQNNTAEELVEENTVDEVNVVKKIKKERNRTQDCLNNLEELLEEQIVDIGSTGKSPSNSNQSNEVRRSKRNRNGSGNYTLPNSNEGELLEGQMVEMEDNNEGHGNKYNQLSDVKKTKKKKKDSAYQNNTAEENTVDEVNVVKKIKKERNDTQDCLNNYEELVEHIVDIDNTGKSPSSFNQSSEVRRFKKNRKGTGNYTLPNSNEGELLEGQMVDTEDNKEGNGNKYNQLNDAKKTKKKKKDSAYQNNTAEELVEENTVDEVNVVKKIKKERNRTQDCLNNLEELLEEQIVDIDNTGKSPSRFTQSNEVRRFKKNRKGTGNYTLPNSNERELLEGQMVGIEDNNEVNENKYNQLNDVKKTKKKKKDSVYQNNTAEESVEENTVDEVNVVKKIKKERNDRQDCLNNHEELLEEQIVDIENSKVRDNVKKVKKRKNVLEQTADTDINIDEEQNGLNQLNLVKKNKKNRKDILQNLEEDLVGQTVDIEDKNLLNNVKKIKKKRTHAEQLVGQIKTDLNDVGQIVDIGDKNQLNEVKNIKKKRTYEEKLVGQIVNFEDNELNEFKKKRTYKEELVGQIVDFEDNSQLNDVQYIKKERELSPHFEFLDNYKGETADIENNLDNSVSDVNDSLQRKKRKKKNYNMKDSPDSTILNTTDSDHLVTKKRKKKFTEDLNDINDTSDINSTQNEHFKIKNEKHIENGETTDIENNLDNIVSDGNDGLQRKKKKKKTKNCNMKGIPDSTILHTTDSENLVTKKRKNKFTEDLNDINDTSDIASHEGTSAEMGKEYIETRSSTYEELVRMCKNREKANVTDNQEGEIKKKKKRKNAKGYRIEDMEYEELPEKHSTTTKTNCQLETKDDISTNYSPRKRDKKNKHQNSATSTFDGEVEDTDATNTIATPQLSDDGDKIETISVIKKLDNDIDSRHGSLTELNTHTNNNTNTEVKKFDLPSSQLANKKRVRLEDVIERRRRKKKKIKANSSDTDNLSDNQTLNSTTNKFILDKDGEESDATIDLSEYMNGDELDKSELDELFKLRIRLPFKEIPQIHQIKVPSKATPDEVKAANLLGVKTGIFTREEDNIIIKNWEQFRKDHNLTLRPAAFFKFRNMVDVEEKIKFLQYLSHGLNRIPYNIHVRFRKLFETTKKGRFSAEEDRQILEYITTTTSKTPFKYLSMLLNRSITNIEKRYRLILNTPKNRDRLSWNLDSSQKMIKAMMEIAQTERVGDLKDFKFNHEHWKYLSQILFNAPTKKLEQAWYQTVHPRLFLKGNINVIKVELVEQMIANGEDDYRNIPWKEYAKMFEGMTHIKLNELFKKLLISKVPQDIRIDLKRSLTYLAGINFEPRSKRRITYKIKHGSLIRKRK